MSIKNMPPNASAALMLADGSVFWGKGIGAPGFTGGETCFNTSMTGYQEILTDPSYAGQIITFTFPHIGNVGTNALDMEAAKPFATGVILRTDVTSPSNYRSEVAFKEWLLQHNLTGICNVDTRALTHHLRENGSQNAIIAYPKDGKIDFDVLLQQVKSLPSMDGLDIAKDVSCKTPYSWEAPVITNAHVVVVDYGVKRNILRCLAQHGMQLTVVPCTATAEEIMALKPDGIFLSNGPGDPAATGAYAVPVIQSLMKTGLPLFGICLGHQLLALAVGGKTAKMPDGHRGANHPVKDLQTGKVEITSQNHGFHVLPETLPADVEITHISLFDKTNEGLRLKNRPVFSVQYHPEASPGPQDSHYLFERFATFIKEGKRKAA